MNFYPMLLGVSARSPDLSHNAEYIYIPTIMHTLFGAPRSCPHRIQSTQSSPSRLWKHSTKTSCRYSGGPSLVNVALKSSSMIENAVRRPPSCVLWGGIVGMHYTEAKAGDCGVARGASEYTEPRYLYMTRCMQQFFDCGEA
jgi:hypothetical protein